MVSYPTLSGHRGDGDDTLSLSTKKGLLRHLTKRADKTFDVCKPPLHPGITLSCDVCWEKFRSLRELQEHTLAAHQLYLSSYQCYKCNHRASHPGQLVVHMRQQHMITIDVELVKDCLASSDLDAILKRKRKRERVSKFDAEDVIPARVPRESIDKLARLVKQSKVTDYDFMVPPGETIRCPFCMSVTQQTFVGPAGLVALRAHLSLVHGKSFTTLLCVCARSESARASAMSCGSERLSGLEIHPGE